MTRFGPEYGHITHGVSILATGGYNLDDADFETLARAWPNIEILRLKSTWHPHPPRVTIGSLRMLAERCPYISDLELTFDASTIPPPVLFHSRQQLLQEYLTTLDVAHSSISNAFHVALYVSGIYCNLTSIVTDKDDWDLEEEEGEVDEQDRLEKEWSNRWKEVERMLPGLNECCSEEFNWGCHSIELADHMPFEFPI